MVIYGIAQCRVLLKIFLALKTNQTSKSFVCPTSLYILFSDFKLVRLKTKYSAVNDNFDTKCVYERI